MKSKYQLILDIITTSGINLAFTVVVASIIAYSLGMKSAVEVLAVAYVFTVVAAVSIKVRMALKTHKFIEALMKQAEESADKRKQK